MKEEAMRILLVEDNKADVRIISEMLRSTGALFHITSATRLAAAFECLSREEFDIVLLDLGLPDSAGFETFSSLHDAAPKLPIVVLTGLDDEALAVRAVRDGAQDFLTKMDLNKTALDRAIRYAIERKHVQEALRESEERYRLAIESAIDGVGIIKETSFTYASHELARMFGYDAPGDLVGKPLATIVHPEHQALVMGYCLEKQKGLTAPGKYEFKGLRKDDQLIFVEASETAVRYHGEINCLAYFRDVTERKKMERQLLRMQKLETINELAGGIAHDFNNLLSLTLGYTTLARLDSASHSKVHEHLREAEKSILQTGDLVRKFMAFAKGGTPLKHRSSVSELMGPVIERILNDPRMQCVVLLPDDLWQVVIDRVLMTQVLHNIFQNACEAMPEGGTITIRAKNLEMTLNRLGSDLPAAIGEYVKLSIHDQGVGIPEDCLHRVFDPYFSTKARGTQRGMGLGLTFALSAVRNQGGDIDLESKQGLGTTVNLYLPAVQMVPEECIESGQRQPATMGKRVLAMDDHDGMRGLTKALLERLGYEADVARDEEEAVRLYTEARTAGAPFDAVILEQTVGGGRGGEKTLARLLNIDPQIRAVVTTKFPDDLILSFYRQQGFEAALAKPYNLKELGQVLSGILESRT
jgi:two-component system, cell cycle sensor histidine kinase and response regulator CckA